MENYLTSSQSTTTTPFYKDFTTMPLYNTLGASVAASSLSDSYRPTLIGDASQEKSPVKLNPTSYTTSYSPYYNKGCSSDSKSGTRACDSITDSYFSNFNTEDRNGYQLASPENDLYRSMYKDPQTPETKTQYSVDSILSPYQPAGDLGNNQTPKDSESMSTQDSSAEKSDEEEERDVETTLKRYPVSSGLPNLGNTCYMNSVLQCLFNTEKLCDALEKNRQDIENSQRAPLTQRFLETLKSAFTKHSSTRNMSESLRPFKKALEKVAPIFKGYSQNDAHELFRLLTEKMHDELNQAPKKSGRYVEFTPSKNKDLSEQVEEWKQYSQDRDDSLFTSLFGGILLTEVKCNHCNHVSYTFEDALDLSLNLVNLKVDEDSDRYDSVTSLYTCLKDYATPEFVDGYACDKCKRRDSSYKRTTVWKQPETLVVQLKRFVYDMYGDQETVKDLVSFPLKNLRLDEIMHEESNEEEARYQLYGIVNHFGSLDFGHYTAYVYNDQQKCWYQYNDDQVTRMDDEDMREFARGSSEPYILFYRKI